MKGRVVSSTWTRGYSEEADCGDCEWAGGPADSATCRKWIREHLVANPEHVVNEYRTFSRTVLVDAALTADPRAEGGQG